MQATNNILLVRPANFIFNAQTETSNAFQTKIEAPGDNIQQKVIAEFDQFAEILKSHGVTVNVFNDTAFPIKPDAIFPNNWVTFHADGMVILYPMQAPNRQLERRQDILEDLRKHFNISTILDLSVHEKNNQFLEGTGSIIFDHDHKIAYACISPRTDKELFLNLCNRLQYKAISFDAHDENGKEIYHTNVMMCIGEKFVAICLDSITNDIEKENVTSSLVGTGHEIIDITFEQMKNFAGNMLELKTTTHKSIVALSQRAFESLTSAQKAKMIQYVDLVPLNIKTIETIGGGSVRCMIAEIFLPPR